MKVSLCRHPKTPLEETTRLLPFLRPVDLESLGGSKTVPSAVAAHAKERILQRGSR